ncbi:MAG: chemotaxis protein CheW [Armatimonadetes bacterium CG2_30_59_28]|nr:chemotaxis protein CheW [Armatimonadota bacterium]OIO90490.1 MAG: chemotaxis protein CheW [Armatimonadetes bacterium CG2_30_59_28]PIU67199.1 MAG: chemotaxis protein CheW [Armatimonadetes bacterium CG07_land_8_20_14_0_80_59_28]PIX39270.1 MAG: chemotaxis protein CheW [Armatimonadetes bacterium CG_4_8_14_3_um_filter_58_9]PJB71849.1 MAG: chemotaxis protein CheW [Armatimonadetes bacterium CG_4_9_14_3_um_filter_58_7]
MTEVATTTDELQLVVFRLADEEFAVEVGQVQEIVEMLAITRLPRAPHFIKGIINLRGKILPVIDLRERLGLPEQCTEAQRIVITRLEDQSVGMIVDAVTEVLRIPQATIEPPPQMVSDVSGAYLRGIGRLDGRLLILMDLTKVLSTEDAEALVAQPGGSESSNNDGG